jgi:hypothetical protein
MGLDILISTDIGEQIYTEDFLLNSDNYSLSRTFCNFIGRQNVADVEPELDQIGKLTGVDIMPLYEMETYGSESGEELEFFIEVAETEEEKQAIRDNAKAAKEKLKGNINRVTDTIAGLLNKLPHIDNLPDLLNHGMRDTLDSKVYFANFSVDTGKGYIGNNFGQDLRNFKRFLEYAKSKRAQTVYFIYG